MEFISKLYNRFYQPIGWSIVAALMIFCIWGMIDDFNIGCYHSAWRLLMFFLIVLSPLFFALVLFKPKKST